jgi:hypothetical protein
MCPGHIFEITDTGTHYDWFERAKHIFEIMNTGTHYRWFEIMNTGIHSVFIISNQ